MLNGEVSKLKDLRYKVVHFILIILAVIISGINWYILLILSYYKIQLFSVILSLIGGFLGSFVIHLFLLLNFNLSYEMRDNLLVFDFLIAILLFPLISLPILGHYILYNLLFYIMLILVLVILPYLIGAILSNTLISKLNCINKKKKNWIFISVISLILLFCIYLYLLSIPPIIYAE